MTEQCGNCGKTKAEHTPNLSFCMPTTFKSDMITTLTILKSQWKLTEGMKIEHAIRDISRVIEELMK